MKTHKRATGLTILITLFFTSLAIADEHWTDDWEIVVDGKAESAGTISFTLTFEPGEDGTGANPVTVDVLIPADTSENDVAEIISNDFRAVLGDDGFKIDVSWGETVDVKARRDTADFVLTLSSNSVQGISLEIDD